MLRCPKWVKTNISVRKLQLVLSHSGHHKTLPKYDCNIQTIWEISPSVQIGVVSSVGIYSAGFVRKTVPNDVLSTIEWICHCPSTEVVYEHSIGIEAVR